MTPINDADKAGGCMGDASQSELVGVAAPAAERMKANAADGAANDADSKAFSTLQARAVMKGCSLRPLAGGGYLISQWSYSREVPDLRTVCSLLRRMGA